MSAPVSAGPPPPPPHHGLDPIAEAIGELKADVRWIRQRLDRFEETVATKEALGTLATKIETLATKEALGTLATRLRHVERLVWGLYPLLIVGLTVIGWLVTRPH